MPVLFASVSVDHPSMLLSYAPCLQILIPQIEPLTEAQLLSVCNLQQQSQQAEDALSQGMEALQQSLADTLSTGSISTVPNMANYMGQMAIAMGKLGALETFVRQVKQLSHCLASWLGSIWLGLLTRACQWLPS
jgi:hypothetical protein